MSYQVLARKWRPQKFEDVIGQGHVSRSLQNNLRLGKLAHAYLLTGTRGVGKTTLARIFAKSLRCEQRQVDGNPCLVCPSCLDIARDRSVDVVEIDGASHNGVDDIREIIENLRYLPTFGKHKVYIIDEVHMLSKEAFNALLKTIEEPPEHVIFVFATTNPQKIPDTVLSRCMRFDLRALDNENLLGHLKAILEKESVKFSSEENLLSLIATARGSARDALSLLDQVLSYAEDGQTITEEILVEALGLVRSSSLLELVDAIILGDVLKVSERYREMVRENIELEQLCLGILNALYGIIDPSKTTKAFQYKEASRGEIFWIYEVLVKDFTWGLKSLGPVQVIEIILQKVTYRREFFGSKKKDAEAVETRPAVSTQQKEEHKAEPSEEPKKEHKIEARAEASASAEFNEVEKELEIDDTVEIPPQVELQAEPQVEPEPVAEFKQPEVRPSPQVVSAVSWQGFIDFLFQRAPALGANIEQGNVSSDLGVLLQERMGENFVVEILYGDTEKVFAEYLQRADVALRLKGLFVEYLALAGIAGDKGELKLRVLGAEEKEQTGHQTYAERARQQVADAGEKIKQDILNEHYIKEAERLFGSKVDKIILNNHLL